MIAGVMCRTQDHLQHDSNSFGITAVYSYIFHNLFIGVGESNSTLALVNMCRLLNFEL